LAGNPTFDDSSCQGNCRDIYTAFRTFGEVQQTLLLTINTKAYYFYDTPLLGKPIQDSLQNQKNALDAFFGAVLNGCTGFSNPDILNQGKLVNAVYDQAIRSYSGTANLGS
jgi:hypothetical protein